MSGHVTYENEDITEDLERFASRGFSIRIEQPTFNVLFRVRSELVHDGKQYIFNGYDQALYVAWQKCKLAIHDAVAIGRIPERFI